MDVLNLSDLRPAPGSKHRRKLLGRGEGTGHGQTSTRGMKGQRSRSGDGRMPGFEGGQIPLLRRLPKRGFNNAEFRTEYSVVNLEVLERCFKAGDKVDPESLLERGLLRRDSPVKILGNGTLTKKLTVAAHAASARAREAITKAGGEFQLIGKQASA
ncbi:MAG: 50S ribosomal protein L15 [Elusimicrobia bacterium]|nr:50S ribosomal protein L15 [Elusimicrobiota bacterium]